LEEAELRTCGAKSAGARRLWDLAATTTGAFRARDGLVVPFGVMGLCLAGEPGLAQPYRTLLSAIAQCTAEEEDGLRERLQRLARTIPVPQPVVDSIVARFGKEARLAVRSSANGEDLEGLAGAGLYDSVVGVTAPECTAAIQQVWASLWTARATQSRRQAGIPHGQIHMAVLIQELVCPEYSFILHTTHPLNGSRDTAWVELAVGLGETLASACQPGTPFRLLCARQGGAVELARCASFSLALRPNGEPERINYAQVPLAVDAAVALRLGRRFGAIAEFLEERLAGPQDVEGVVTGEEEVYIVQTRPQQGVGVG
jgi:phosphoglucan,water dikinase